MEREVDKLFEEAPATTGAVAREIAEAVELVGRIDTSNVQRVVGVREAAGLAMAAAKELQVIDRLTYEQGCEISAGCTRAIAAVEKPAQSSPMAEVQEQRENAHKLHRFFTSLISSLTKPYEEARKVADGKCSTWYRAEQRRLEQEAEARRKAEQKRLEDERLAQAEALEETNPQAAEALLAAPAPVAPPIEAARPADVAGISHRENWQAEGTDLRATLTAIFDGKADIALVCYDQKELTKRAKMLKQGFRAPGIRVYDAGSTAHRS